MKIIIVFGKPGAGKGTQISRFRNYVKAEKWKHISTGDLIRKAIKEGSQLGKQVKTYSDKGELVPDELVVSIVKSEIESFEKDNVKGVILDGFPRNVKQIEAMYALGLIPSSIINLDITDEEVISRLSGRVVCEHCGEAFSTTLSEKMPQVEGICDTCGGRLIRRKDDQNLETIKNRLRVYATETAPVLNAFKEKGVEIKEFPIKGNEELFAYYILA